MKVISQNLWNINPPVGERLSAFVALCNQYKPDVLLLQENSFSAELGTDIASTIAVRLGMEHKSCFPAGTWRGRDEGLAIITRAEHRVEKYLVLTEGADKMGRCLGCVGLALDATEVYFATTHFAHYLHDNEGRNRQAQEVRDALRCLLEKNRGSRLVLGGDLNCSPNEDPVRTLRTGLLPLIDPFDLQESPETWSYRADNPYAAPELGLNRRIDYLLFSNGLNCVRAEVLTPAKTGLGVWSDHSAIFIEIAPEGIL